jgi:cell division protein FtsB
VPKARRPVKKPVQKQPTRSEKRRSRETRRTRLLFIGATVLSAAILAAWFPASALLHQRASLATANGQLARLHSEDTALSQERQNLSDSAEVGRIARQQYQLVSPGQQAFAILPPSGTAPANAPYAGDPGQSAPVAPSAASELPPGTVTTTTEPATVPPPQGSAQGHDKVSSGSAPAEGTLQRMVRALEFWR